MKFQKYRLNKIIIFLILLFLVIIPNKVYAIKSPTSNFYVNDYVNVLSEDVEDYIIEKSVKLYNADGTQIVVSVIDSLEGLSIEEYALEMFRSFGIGDNEKNNGILILLSIKDREVRIEVGYGLEGIINDGKAGRIIDNYMIPSFSNDNWQDGITKGYEAVFAEIVNKNGLNLDYDKSYLDEEDDINKSIFLFFCFITIGEVLVYINVNYGNKLREMETAISKKTARVYMLLLIILFLILLIFKIKYIMLLILFKFIAFVLGYLGISKVNNIYGGYSSGRRSFYSGSSFRSGSSSRSSHRGGGGSSGGGGASRRF